MKIKFLTLTALIVVLVSCKQDENSHLTGTGTLSIDYGLNTNVSLKSANEDVSVEDFGLVIMDDQDENIENYDNISDAPAEIELETGIYTVLVYSEEFEKPAFENPVYGDEEEVSIVSGENAEVSITCTQTNAGLTFDWFNISSSFSIYSAIVISGTDTLVYSSTETRIGYFPTGDVEIEITLGDEDGIAIYNESLTLNEKEVVTISPVVAEAESGSLIISITIDEVVDERTVEVELGDSNDANAVLAEDFSTATAGSTNGDGSNSTWDGNDNWSVVERAYETAGSIRLGSQSTLGYITSTALDLSGNDGAFSVSFDVKGWYDSDTIMVVSTTEENDTIVFSSSGKEYDMVSVIANFTAATDSTEVTIGTLMDGTATIRVFVDNIVVSL